MTHAETREGPSGPSTEVPMNRATARGGRAAAPSAGTAGEAPRIGGTAPDGVRASREGGGGPRSTGADKNGVAPDRADTDTTGRAESPAEPRRSDHAIADIAVSDVTLPAVTVTTEGLPEWLVPVARLAHDTTPEQWSRFLPPANGSGRKSAVLVLFGAGAQGPEILLMERATSLRSHAGQPSFPGGALDPEDGDPTTTGPLRAALREAEEETGLDPSGVQLFGVLPDLYIPVSDFVVTPVLGWWRAPSPIRAVDAAETARVFTVPVGALTDPANRVSTVHPRGHHGPGFLCGSALVWGFTAGVIDRILHFAGWEEPWDREKRVPLDWRA